MKNILLIIMLLSTLGHTEMSRDDNGILTDLDTNLEWDDTPNKIRRTWDDAIKYCTDLKLGDHNDWRLPNINELMSVANYTPEDRVWHESFMENTVANLYWTSTTVHKSPRDAWAINFKTGRTDNTAKSHAYRLRCVRTKS